MLIFEIEVSSRLLFHALIKDLLLHIFRKTISLPLLTLFVTVGLHFSCYILNASIIFEQVLKVCKAISIDASYHSLSFPPVLPTQVIPIQHYLKSEITSILGG